MSRDRLAAIVLAAAYAVLGLCHAAGATRPGRALPGGLLVVQDVLVCALLLARRASRSPASRASDRVVAVAALLLPLGLQAPDGSTGIPIVLEIAGLLLAVLATATLGRDLGVLPAVRGVTTRGVYAVVRHPMYAAYLLVFVAYVAGMPSARNVALGFAVMALLVLRLRAEEAMLRSHVEYRAYCLRVPWRLVPGCY